MVQPEDRIEPGGVGIGHQARSSGFRIAAPDQTVHHVMRLLFESPWFCAAMLESRVDAAEAAAAAARRPR